MRILIVDDIQPIAVKTASALENVGYVPEIVCDGEMAWFLGDTEDYAAIILKLTLPKLDGMSVLKRWRKSGISTPVLILTAQSSWTERVEGIDAGADDYLTQPFHIEELLARLRAIFRRVTGHACPLIQIGNVIFDPRRTHFSVEGTPIPLTPLEYRTAAYLIYHQNRVISQNELSEHVYGDNGNRRNNALEAIITRLRRKLGPDFIQTRRGHGYTITDSKIATAS